MRDDANPLAMSVASRLTNRASRRRVDELDARMPRSTSTAGSNVKEVVVWLLCACLAVATIYPVYFILSTALREPAAYAANPNGLPVPPSITNISAALDIGVGRYALTTLLNVVASIAIIIPVSCSAGFALSCLRAPLRRAVLVLVLISMMLPAPTIVIPTFKIIDSFGLLDTRAGLVLVYIGLNTPVTTYLMSAFFRRLPNELLEAARIDGAGPVRMFVRIGVPLVRSAIASLAILNFFWLWNEFFFAQILVHSDALKTVTVGLAGLQGQFTVDVPTLTGGLTLGLLPPLVMFLVTQRYFRQGMMQGAFKG